MAEAWHHQLLCQCRTCHISRADALVPGSARTERCCRCYQTRMSLPDMAHNLAHRVRSNCGSSARQGRPRARTTHPQESGATSPAPRIAALRRQG
eukprot:50403-Rhodomonas_salina.1